MNTATVGRVPPPVNGPERPSRALPLPATRAAGGRTRRAVLRAAADLFVTQGYADTTVADVARTGEGLGRHALRQRRPQAAAAPGGARHGRWAVPTRPIAARATGLRAGRFQGGEWAPGPSSRRTTEAARRPAAAEERCLPAESLRRWAAQSDPSAGRCGEGPQTRARAAKHAHLRPPSCAPPASCARDLSERGRRPPVCGRRTSPEFYLLDDRTLAGRRSTMSHVVNRSVDPWTLLA
jgi:hypothetical protein